MDISSVLNASKIAIGADCVGLLGSDFLDSNDAIIDYKNRWLYLRDARVDERLALQGNGGPSDSFISVKTSITTKTSKIPNSG